MVFMGSKRFSLSTSQLLIAAFLAWVLALVSVQAQASLFNKVKHPLPVDKAFALKVDQYQDRIDIVWTIANNYYLYQDKLEITTSNNTALEGMVLPEAQMKQDPLFGLTKVYYKQLHLSGTIAGESPKPTQLTINYQGCWSGGVCYPPTSKTITLDYTVIPAVTSNAGEVPLEEQNKREGKAPSVVPSTNGDSNWKNASGTNANWFLQNFENATLPSVLVVFFLAGLALALTPCVLPMMPILSTIILGISPKPGPLKSFGLSLVYVLAMAGSYSIAGVIAGLSGANVQIALQHPVVISLTALLFVVFAAAMFGFINVQMPTAIQNKINAISQNQTGGQATGVAAMGVLSALVVGPCVAAPLAGALLFIAQTGDAFVGGLALFVMGLGMGVPLLLVGTSASKLVPKAGAWMDRVKIGFGFVMLLMAVWMTDRVFASLTPIFVSAVVIVLAILLALHKRWQPPLTGLFASVLSYALALVLAIYGGALVIGQLSGGVTLTKPLGALIGSGKQTNSSSQTLEFIKVLPADVPGALQAARQAQVPLMLEFYADWCVSCKELEAFVFTNTTVIDALAGFDLVKVDVTENTQAAKSLLQSLDLVGPPALVFYTSAGELVSETIVGVPKAGALSTFAKSIKEL
jgi:thiol:disulfide interchange protein DsbD